MGGQGRGVGRGGPHSLFSLVVGDSPFRFLPGCPGWGNHAAQGRAGEEEKEKAAGRPGGGVEGERQGKGGTGVAPGVRHNPVFGSPGEEFPPLHPLPHPSSPHPPDPHTVPGARGHLLGSLKQVGSATQASATGARRGTPKEKAERGRQGPTQDKGVGVRRPQAQKLPPTPTKAWKWGSTCFLSGVWLEPRSAPRPPSGPAACQVTRALCFGVNAGVGWQARRRGRGGATKVLVL